MNEQIDLSKLPPSVPVKSQTRKYGPKAIKYHGQEATIIATVRYDDQCGNGHNSFAITADIKAAKGRGDRDLAGGCCHEEVAKYFPELAPLIKWHLTGSTGPMHYLANTIFHASDRDHNGLLKGESRQIVNGRTKLPCWILKGPGTKYQDSAECPTETVTLKWQPMLREGEGKERELDHARNSAVWPDATDEQLCQDPAQLRAALLERLPALMVEFKAAVESLGFKY